MKRGEIVTSNPAYSLILMVGLFMIVYVILLPEADKEQFVNDPGQLGNNVVRGTHTGTGSPYPHNTILLSETPGRLYPYTQKLFVKPLASVNLFSTTEKHEQQLSPSIKLTSGLFGQDKKELTFSINPQQQTERARLLFFVQAVKGDLIITLNGKEIYSGVLTGDQLPIALPANLLRQLNTLTFIAPAGFNGKNSYHLRDITIFTEDRQDHKRELRDFVTSRTQLQNLEMLTMYYFVNCFTVHEKGTLRIFLNGNLLSQQLVVCDAGEVSQDIPVSQLVAGRNIFEFTIDDGKYILEQLSLEGNTDQGRIPTYFFTLQHDDVRYNVPVGLELQLLEQNYRSVGRIYVNGIPLYIDTYSDSVFFDVTDYVGPGQNVIKIVPETEMDIVDLTVFMG